MATKLNVLRLIIDELGSVFPDLTPHKEIYLVPKIKALTGMAPLEVQVCEDGSVYEFIQGATRSEDFVVLVGIFRKYRLDSGDRHAKALADLTISIFKIKELVISVLDGKFLKEEILTRPLVIKAESNVEESAEYQLLKTLQFTAGLNTEMGEEYVEFSR